MLRLTALLQLLVVAATVVRVRAQIASALDGDGNTVVVSFETDAAGETIATNILSTVLPAAAVTTPVVPGAVTTPVAGAGGVGAANPDPTTYINGYNPTCTTSGCIPRPTTYTQDGVIATFVATTPTTPVPTWTSSGRVQALSSYVTTTYTTSLAGASRLSALGGNLAGDAVLMGVLGTLVAGLAGAAWAL